MKTDTPPVPPTAKLGGQEFLIIKIRSATINERGSLYEAVRRNWAVSTARAENRPVVAVTLDDNVIQEIYDVKEWHVKVVRQTKAGKSRDFYEFTGKPMSGDPWADALIGKRIPDRYIGGQNCVRYVN